MICHGVEDDRHAGFPIFVIQLDFGLFEFGFGVIICRECDGDRFLRLCVELERERVGLSFEDFVAFARDVDRHAGDIVIDVCDFDGVGYQSFWQVACNVLSINRCVCCHGIVWLMSDFVWYKRERTFFGGMGSMRCFRVVS